MKETRFKQTEIGLIPEDWKVVSISKIAETSSGGTPSRSIKRYYNGTIRWITTSELKDSRIYDSIEHITEEAVQNSSAKMFPKGTILMAMYGATIGKLGILEVCSTTNQACCAIICHDIKNIYLFYYLFFIRKDIILQGCGAGQPNISQNIVKNINIRLPEKIEQNKIASALTSIDNLLLSLDKLIDKKRLIKQGAMQELLTGKKRLPGFTGEWKASHLGELCIIKDGTHQTPRYVENGIPFFSVENVTNNNFKRVKYITSEDHNILTKNYRIEKGDVLMTRIGSIGICKYIDWDVNASFYVSLALLKFKEPSLAKFFSFYSMTERFIKDIESNSLQFASPKKINLSNISSVRIEYPTSKDEMEAITIILSSIEKELESLESKKAKYEHIKQGMMQQLLTGKIRLIS